MQEDSPNSKGRKVLKRETPVSVKAVESTAPRNELGEQVLKDQLLGRILEAADDAIISVDQGQRIILFNRGAERIFGWNAPEILGKPLDLLLPRNKARAKNTPRGNRP